MLHALFMFLCSKGRALLGGGLVQSVEEGVIIL